MLIQNFKNSFQCLLKLTILIVLIIFFMQYTSLSLYQNEINVSENIFKNQSITTQANNIALSRYKSDETKNTTNQSKIDETKIVSVNESKIVKYKEVSTNKSDALGRKYTSHIKTYNNFEKEHHLCSSIPKTQLFQNIKCPNSGIVTVIEGGRLGNQIWEYISVWLVAKETGLEPYVPSCIKSRLSTLFDYLNLPLIQDIYHCPVKETSKNQNIILPMFVVKPELLAERINDIKKVFSIRQTLLIQSQKKLHEGVKYLNSTFDTFVGVHARRTDYLVYLRRKYKIVPHVTNFFKSAMTYFENKYPKTIFIFVSDDPQWCLHEFGFKKNVYVTGRDTKNSPELDIAIMASCNHSIIDYGTFGQWGALLAGGETVYYEITPKYSSDVLGKHLSNWHTIQFS